MTYIYGELLETRFNYITSKEAAEILGITHLGASRLVAPGQNSWSKKLAGFYVIPRTAVLEYGKGYVPRRGRPRIKRKYTKKSRKQDKS